MYCFVIWKNDIPIKYNINIYIYYIQCNRQPNQPSQIFHAILPLLGKIWSLISNYAICSIVIVVDNDTESRDITPHIQTRDIDIYEEITKIMQKRNTISYLPDSYNESYNNSYITSCSRIKSLTSHEKEPGSTKPIPIILRR